MQHSTAADREVPAPGVGGPTGDGATAAELAYEALRTAVLAGNFKPGEVLTLRALVSLLGMGDTPVREALKRLISEGAFEGLPNRSARLPTLTRRQVEQILTLRQTLEGNAAYLCAENITTRQIQRLRALETAMDGFVQTGNVHAYTSTNMAFHFEIYTVADNEVLLSLIQALWLRMAPLVGSTVSLLARDSTVFRSTGVSNHKKMLDAFQARDPAAAEKAMREDISTSTRLPGYWEAIEAAAKPASRPMRTA
jgi:DNA-binding GntR family transcriptional regulator